MISEVENILEGRKLENELYSVNISEQKSTEKLFTVERRIETRSIGAYKCKVRPC